MEDERNQLFLHYRKFLDELRPDGFVFENVSGLLNMEKGQVFARVKAEFESVMGEITGWVLSSEEFAIPQRRTRVFLLASKHLKTRFVRPVTITARPKLDDLFNDLKPWVSVEDALGDLPELSPGEDGSFLSYSKSAATQYQKLMRGIISPEGYYSAY
mgnify:CR=1 FL=1